MEDVRQWLNSDRDFFAGRDLYLKYGSDDALRSLFQTDDVNRFKSEKLFKALREIFTQPAKTQESHKADTRKIQKAAPAGWKKNTKDAVLKALRAQWEPLFKEMKTLHAQLLLIDNDEQRGVVAHRILDLDDMCTEIYQKRDHYMQTGKLPDEKEPDKVVDPSKFAVRLEAAKRYVRRYKNYIKKNPENEKYIQKLKQYEDEVLFYTKKLKLDEEPG